MIYMIVMAVYWFVVFVMILAFSILAATALMAAAAIAIYKIVWGVFKHGADKTPRQDGEKRP